MSKAIRSQVAQGIARLILDNPPLNILTREVLRQLREECAAVAFDEDVRVLVLQAEGRHFSAGADVGEHLPPQYEALIPEFLDTVRALVMFPLPVIAAVHGKCLGGAFELVQASDIVLASSDAVFGQPEIHLGVFPPAACVTLTTLLPRGTTAEILFTGDPIDAAEAYRVGLVHRIAPDGQLLETVMDMAQRIARHSAVAVRAAKRAWLAGTDKTLESFDVVGGIYDQHMKSPDAVEGLNSFLEKRKPQWSQR